jgi:hypothetical protein
MPEVKDKLTKDFPSQIKETKFGPLWRGELHKFVFFLLYVIVLIFIRVLLSVLIFIHVLLLLSID